MVNEKRFLLLDSTGLGKTYTVLINYAVLQKFVPGIRFLCVCTKKASKTWKDQIKEHTHFTIRVYNSTNSHLNEKIQTLADVKEDISVVTYPSLSKFPNLFRVLLKETSDCLLIVDETHRIKDPMTNQGKFVRYMISYASYAWGLTATPMLNHIEDIFHVVDAYFPRRLATDVESFLNQYTVRVKRKIKNSKTGREHVFKEVVGYRDLRPLIQDLEGIYLKRSRDLDIRYHYKAFALSEEEEDLYLEAAKGILHIRFKAFVARLHDLQLVANGTVGLQGEFIPDRKDMTTKELQFMVEVDDRLSQGLPVVVFTHYRKTLQRLEWLLRSYQSSVKNLYTITGDTKEEDVNQAVDNFSKGDILLMTSAGGESLNLQICNTVIFYDTPFSLGALVQVIGRVARMDTTYDHIDVVFLQAKETIDDYKHLLVSANTDLINQVVGGNVNLPRTTGKTTRRLIMEMRKKLLWKIHQRVV